MSIMDLRPYVEPGPELARIGFYPTKYEEFNEAPRKKYAVLILGDVGTAILRSASENTGMLVYRALLQSGYKSEHIISLDGREGNAEPLPCRNLPLDKETISQLFGKLSKEVINEDSFFLYVLSHGHRRGLVEIIGESYLALNSGIISERELEKLLFQINPDHSLLFFNSCFGGGFAERLGCSRTVAVSTSGPEKVTYAQHSPRFENGYGFYGSQFTLNFFSALEGRTLDGAPIDLGTPSVMTSFKYASKAVEAKHVVTPFRNVPRIYFEKINPNKLSL